MLHFCQHLKTAWRPIVNVDIRDVREFFFRSALEGWAADVASCSVNDMPGYKEISYPKGDFLMVDRYCINPGSSRSSGTKTIWFRETPVWVMHYGGHYEASVIPFLKRALMKSYQGGVFNGGRGPAFFGEGEEADREDSTLRYWNHAARNGFDDFLGIEQIVSGETGGKRLGWHRYWGMSLL